MNAARLLGAASTAAGLILIVRPHQVGEAVTGSDHGVPAPWVVRLLGARMSLQGAIELLRPDTTVLVLGVVTDVLHSASMFALAGLDRTYRRPALTSAAVAAANAAATGGIAFARRSQ